MKRRVLMAALTGGLAGLAGCQGLVGAGDTRKTPYDVPPRETPTPTVTATPQDVPGIEPGGDLSPETPPVRTVSRELGAERRLSVASPPLSSNPGRGVYTVGFTSPPTPSSPATLWVAFRSTAEETRTYEFGPTPPFSNYWALRAGDGTVTDEYQRGLLLVPTDDRPFPYGDLVPDEPGGIEGKIWFAADELGSPESEIQRWRVELAPGEVIQGEYALLRHPDAGEFPRRGSYFFDGADWTEPTLTLSTWDPALRGQLDSRFEDPSVPKLSGQSPTRWYHEADDFPPTFLAPGSERGSLPRFVLAPTVENYTSTTVGVGRRFVSKLQDDRWWYVGPYAPESGNQPNSLPPGGSFGWGLSVEPPEAGQIKTGSTTPTVALTGLGPGLYALGTAVYGVPNERMAGRPVRLGRTARTDRGTTTPPRALDRDGQTILAALVRFEGDDPGLVRSSKNLSFLEESGDRVRIGLLKEDVETGRSRSTLVLERVGGTGGRSASELIDEQVNQFEALRSGLSFFEPGVDAVEVVAPDWVANRPLEVFGDGEELSFTHRGEAYRAHLESSPEGTTRG